MDNAASVRVAQCACNLVGKSERVIDRQLSIAREQVAQALALHVRHHVEEKSRALAGIVQRQDVGMSQSRRGGDLAEKPVVAQRGRQFGAQHLDRHRTLVSEVLSEIYRGHTANADLAFEAISVGQC